MASRCSFWTHLDNVPIYVAYKEPNSYLSITFVVFFFYFVCSMRTDDAYVLPIFNSFVHMFCCKIIFVIYSMCFPQRIVSFISIPTARSVNRLLVVLFFFISFCSTLPVSTSCWLIWRSKSLDFAGWTTTTTTVAAVCTHSFRCYFFVGMFTIGFTLNPNLQKRTEITK